MEFLATIIISLAAYYAGTQESNRVVAPKVEESQQCAKMCETGVVAQYKWCKCQSKALWDGGK